MSLVLAAILSHGVAAAVDQPVPGKASVVRSGALAKFWAKGTFPLPAPGDPGDPTITGAQIRFFDTVASGAGDVTFDLDASGWTALGSPPGSRGYRYKGSDASPPDDVCRLVLVRDSVIKASCKREGGVPLSPPLLGQEGIIVGVPDVSTSAALRYCAEFGGETRRNDANVFQRRDAPAPGACSTAQPPPTPTPRPNFVVIDLDDTRFDGIDRMPALLARLAGEGVSFQDSFTPFAVCAPSRASLFTGRYAVHHGTRAVSGVIGGADTFRESGADQQTIAVWLRDQGYTTGLFGKYINDYAATEQDKGPGGTFYIPPGWDRWRAFVSPEHYGGVYGQTYTIVDETGTRTVYDDHSSDAQYSTDLLAAWMREFISEAAAGGQPFFALWTPYASHGDSIVPMPAARHYGLFADIELWRPPNWDEADVTDKPRWVAGLAPDPFGGAFTDAIRGLAYETLLSVDEQIAATLDLLASLGIDRDTVVILTSDNGAGWGEHRLFAQRKGCSYEECVRVPMIVRDPRQHPGGPISADQPVLNIDLAPTIAALAGVAVPVAIDGESFASWLGTASPPPPVRADFLMETFRGNRNDSVTYAGQVTDGDRLRLFYGDTRARPRASVLFEFDSGGGVTAGAIAVAIGADADASFSNLRAAVAANVPLTSAVLLVQYRNLVAVDDTPEHHGVYWWEEVDQGNVMTPASIQPDSFGVRDVARGYTYVEFETGEVELYDLNADPWQLENKADDPGYAALRAELAVRLEALLGE